MNKLQQTATRMLLMAMALQGVAAVAGEIPVQLSKPDGKLGNPKKPVKVYLLAGQSNMVGMGDLSGARPLYPSVFLSADPAVIPGVMPVGGAGVGRHGVFEAKAAVYPSPYDPTKQPVQTATVALGTVSETLPAISGPHTLVVTASIDVPATGNYTVHAGFEDSTHSVVTLDGKEVYRKELGGKPVVGKVALEKGKRYPVAITYFKGGSAAFWLEQVAIEGKGDLVTLTKKDNKFPYLLDDAGKWIVRNDVIYKEARLHPESAGSALSAASNNGASIGPELGFGYVMGTFHDEQVLLIKTAQGNRSLGFDFRPPSSGRTDPANEFEGLEYRLMVKGVRETLDKIDKIVPGYQGQGYEMAGFGWFQGHKDSGSTKEDYEKNLVNFIKALRKDFDAPNAKFVLGTMGEAVKGGGDKVMEGQFAVDGTSGKHPEFKGNVATVYTNPMAQGGGGNGHYGGNAEVYMDVGEAMGKAMVELLKGQN